jgi:hypothetical protein
MSKGTKTPTTLCSQLHHQIKRKEILVGEILEGKSTLHSLKIIVTNIAFLHLVLM